MARSSVKARERREAMIADVAAFVAACGRVTTPEILAFLDDAGDDVRQAVIYAARARGVIVQIKGGGRSGPAVYGPPVARAEGGGVS